MAPAPQRRCSRRPCAWAAALAAAAAAAPRRVTAKRCTWINPVFAEFAQRTVAFYEAGTFELEDAARIDKILELREEVQTACPAAVLQALLLKLEENIVYEAGAYRVLMGEYVRLMHSALLDGTLAGEDLQEWPLAKGAERVQALMQELGQHRPLSSAMVMNFCQPEDRFGTMHALNWLLEEPFGPPDPAFPRAGLLAGTELFIYLVDAPWCQALDPNLVTQLERVCKQLHLIPYRGGPQREEQTAYFKFIVDHYDNLPDFTIFVHPDAPEHQGAQFLSLQRALFLLRTQSNLAHDSIGYFPLAQQMVVEPRRTWGPTFAARWRRFWLGLFGHPWRTYALRPPRCRWEAHTGVYIASPVDAAPERQSRPGAKAACSRLHDCAGITCGTAPEDDVRAADEAEIFGAGRVPPESSCTARAGDPPGFFESPGGAETSYEKHCAGEGDSAHEGAGEAAIEKADEQEANYFPLQLDTYFADYAAMDSEVRSLSESKVRCAELAGRCKAVTCDAGSAACTVRAGFQPLRSPSGEVSFRKDTSGEFMPIEASWLAENGASSVFQFYTGSQAIVRKDRLRLWPRETLASLGADGAYCADYSGELEAVWHAMFGEPLSQWPRERDPRLPLFLKWRIPTFYSHGDEGVI